ncbi:MAG: type III pantothenate kinase [Rubripirellula sp.]
MTKSQVIAADVGNTTINLAIQLGDVFHSHAVRIEGTDWPHQVIAWAESLIGDIPATWRVASVQPEASSELIQMLETRRPDSTTCLLTWRDVPMKALVDEPDRLGIDRLLCAYGASRLAAKPMVVVDAGSAITVDCVSDAGEFVGGAILPGLQMQLRSLACSTAALPAIQWQTTKIEQPAKNTEEAMLGGVLAGIAGGIDRLIDNYRDFSGLTDDAIRVVLTGGDGSAISQHLLHNHEQHRDLVCRAVLDLPRSKRSREHGPPTD